MFGLATTTVLSAIISDMTESHIWQFFLRSSTVQHCNEFFCCDLVCAVPALCSSYLWQPFIDCCVGYMAAIHMSRDGKGTGNAHLRHQGLGVEKSTKNHKDLPERLFQIVNHQPNYIQTIQAWTTYLALEESMKSF